MDEAYAAAAHPGQLPVQPLKRAVAMALLLQAIQVDKLEVKRLALIAVNKIIVRGAEICGLSWPCPPTNTMEPATTIKEVHKAWFANGGPANTMRIA